jgi:hypothetical protein
MKPIHTPPVAPRFTTAVLAPGLECLRLRGIVQTSAKERE